MQKLILSLLAPPYGACRYGCAGACAAPIALFWLTGLVAIVYGAVWGGPAGWTGPHTVMLGIGLWAAAAVWAWLTIRGADADRCASRDSTLCSTILPDESEPDPLEEVRKAR